MAPLESNPILDHGPVRESWLLYSPMFPPLLPLLLPPSILASVPDDRYAVSNGSGYAVLICWDEYAVLDRKLDTPYPMEVDTPYSTVDQNSVFKKNN
ncbi:hypothetical protein Tco_1025041 [Tanacetum coccineum]